MITLPTTARRLSIMPLPLGSATTWTPTGARDALSSPLGTYLVHPTLAAAAAHCMRHDGARILSSTEPLTRAEEARLLAVTQHRNAVPP